jgi:hypothetical protein
VAFLESRESLRRNEPSVVCNVISVAAEFMVGAVGEPRQSLRRNEPSVVCNVISVVAEFMVGAVGGPRQSLRRNEPSVLRQDVQWQLVRK